MFKLIGKAVTLITLATIAIPAFFFGQVWWEAHYPTKRSAEFAVVMGAAQYDGRPSDALEARLQEALRLYESGLVKKVITVGAGAPGDRFTEARAGRNWLIKNGVPRDRTIEIAKGTNTINSTQAYVEYLKKNAIADVIIVTDPYHCKRSTYIAKDLRLSATCSPAQSGPFSLANSSLHYLWREGGAYIAYRTLEQIGIHVSDNFENTALNAVGLVGLG
ncbi:MAG: YdcF family protein [Candidatus Nanopelagicaceae bacterium]